MHVKEAQVVEVSAALHYGVSRMTVNTVSRDGFTINDVQKKEESSWLYYDYFFILCTILGSAVLKKRTRT